MERDWIAKTAYSPDEILEILPHRFPFLMVDRVIEVKTGQPVSHGMTESQLSEARKGSFVRTIKNISFNEPQFQGHFPGRPIFPGVLTLEAMAQSAVFATVPFLAVKYNGVLPKLSVALAGFDDVRFRRPVVPGDTLEIKVTAVSVRGAIWSFDGVASVGGNTVAEGRFLAHLGS